MTSELPGPDDDGDGGDTWTGLSRLAAQAAQVLEMSGRIADSGHDGADKLRESLQDELGGLRAAIDYVICQNSLDWGAINRQRDRKRAWYERRGEPSAVRGGGAASAHAAR